jgi:hypothetical protein
LKIVDAAVLILEKIVRKASVVITCGWWVLKRVFGKKSLVGSVPRIHQLRLVKFEACRLVGAIYGVDSNPKFVVVVTSRAS